MKVLYEVFMLLLLLLLFDTTLNGNVRTVGVLNMNT